MSLTVHTNQGAYLFDGPHPTTDPLHDQSGVYVISTNAGNHHKVIDAGESHAVKTRVGSHDRAHLWKQHIIDGLYASVYYCDEASRMALESLVREAHNPPCGVR